MNYLLDKKTIYTHRPPRRPINWRWLVVLILIIIIWWLGPSIFDLTANRVANWATPGLKLGQRVNQYQQLVMANLGQGRNLRQTNLELTQTNTRLTLQVERLSRQLADQMELTHQLSAVNNEPVGLGQVVAGPGHLTYDNLLVEIRQESQDRLVKIGDQVRVANYLTLGRVISRHGNLARIKLYSSADTLVRVVIGPEKIPAIAIGRGNGHWLIRLPQDLDIRPGQAVNLATGAYELLGVVQAVSTKPDEAILEIFAAWPVNFYQLNWVEFYD